MKKNLLFILLMLSLIQGQSHPIVTDSSQFVQRPGYCAEYSREDKLPKWIAYTLDSRMLPRDTLSQLELANDPHFPLSKKLFKRAEKGDIELIPFMPVSHTLAESEHRKAAGYSLNRFPCPYDKNIRRGLEKRMVQWTEDNGPISVVTGPILSPKHLTTESGVTYPRFIFTAVLITSPDTVCMGFLTQPSDTTPSFIEMSAVSVGYLEKLLGYELFPNFTGGDADLYKGELLTSFIWKEEKKHRSPQSGGYATGIDAVLAGIKAKETGYKLSKNTGYRHARQCSFYKAKFTRDCSATEGTPCPICKGELE